MAAVLTLLIFYVFFNLLVPASQGSARASWQIEAQETSASVLNWLAQDVAVTAPSGMSLAPPPSSPDVVIGLHPVAALATDGSQLWATQAIVYHWDPTSQQVMRKLWPPTPPVLSPPLTNAAPYQFTAATLLSIASQANGTERILGGEISAFSVQAGGSQTSGWIMPIHVSLTLQRQIAGAPQPIVVQIGRDIYPNLH